MRIRGARPTALVAVTVLGMFGLASGTIVANTSPKPVASTAVDRGRETFNTSCAECHGKRGRGDGPAAKSLTSHPADLTRLTKPGETFPAAHVEAVLKGTDSVGAHTQVMMTWRALFLADANGSEATAAARVSDVVAFIASIQAQQPRSK